MAIRSISTIELQKELDRRQRGADKLVKRRATLLKELEDIDRELAMLGISGGRTAGGSGRRKSGASSSGGKRSRAKNDMSLPEALIMACEVGAVVSPAEASQLVQANGFKTTSKNFNMMVSNALAKDKRFKRLGRGQYERVS